MNERILSELVDGLLSGAVSRNDFIEQMKTAPVRELGDVRLDVHRLLRRGFGEIIYSQSKSDEQLQKIAQAVKDGAEPCLFSRLCERQASLVRAVCPDLEYCQEARLGGLRRPKARYGGVTVISAGSSDVPVAEEAAMTAEYLECQVTRLYDVGVAGIHRLLSHASVLAESRAIVVVAGMEGALPSVVAGLSGCPVWGVPTSVGYGANLGGLTALLSMVNSCATGLSVVNIDNGLGAGVCAALSVRQASR
ncbi:NCAIR mutase-like protein [Jonquetella anthropi DSM 22815]|uniref:NCAIR mutase-like protein n=1 Tax=Jonquetella anthropi DSM 22815 TaxID=885272 RepID=H0UKN0_9BACT|nr:nickel pincer cofactor biosynthesis protein LarB [Jonquetella anthropi]EHM13239.1 NCAIR mutase-like protein [Jonquetella anthropi DSM 22815]